MHRTYASTVLIAFLLFVPHFAFGACDLNATTSNFAAQLSAAQPGQTVCLATGNYGTFAGANKSSPGVTITAQSGATPTMGINFCSSAAVSWLTLDTITIPGGEICGPTNNVTFQNSHFTAELDIYQSGGVYNNACSSCPAISSSNIVFDNDLNDSASDPNATGTFGGDIVFIKGPNGPTDPSAGITVKNSQFTSGCNDGIDVLGAGHGVTIGPGNVFHGLLQGSCANHVDSIQVSGTDVPGPTITGNYFYNDTTGMTSYDYANDGLINNNVMSGVIQDSLLIAGWDSSSVVEHNTVIGDQIICGQTHEGNNCTAIIRNNITRQFSVGGGTATGQTPAYFDYNLCTSGSCDFGNNTAGPHSLSGTPTYVGGSSPTTYAGFALTSGSLGQNAGSDGKDIGINATSTTGGPSAPTGLVAEVQ